jgi:hypothetical protein
MFAGTLAALIRVVQKGVWFAGPPNRHDKGISNEPRGHLRLHRPANHPPRKQVDNGSNIEPALRGPEVPLECRRTKGCARRLLHRTVWTAPSMRIARTRSGSATSPSPLSLGPMAILPPPPCAERLGPHQPLNAMQTAVEALRQHVVPDPQGTVSAGASDEARPHLRADLFIIPASLGWGSAKPSMKTRPLHVQCWAEPEHGPDRAVPRDKSEPDVFGPSFGPMAVRPSISRELGVRHGS